MDITATRQAAWNYIAANFPAGGDIEYEPATYLLNGPAQTGTYIGQQTTVNGAGQTINQTPSTLSVGGSPTTAGFAAAGQMTVPGVSGAVSYTGISGNTFTGCTVATGSGTATNGGTVTGSSYSYAGQLLIPALSMANTMAIRERGKIRPGSGNSNTGGPSGTILVSSLASGYLVDCVPAYTRFQQAGQALCCWTGCNPAFEDIVFLVPDNPQCGGFNMYATQRVQFRRVFVQNPTFDLQTLNGSLAGIVMPQILCNGDTVLRDVFVRGFPTGCVPGEHNVLDNYTTSGCINAFGSQGYSNVNHLQYVDVEECAVVFNGAAYGGITGLPNTQPGMGVEGMVAYDADGGGQIAPVAFVSDTRAGQVQGQIRLWAGAPGPTSGGAALDLVPLNRVPSNGPLPRSGWMSTHPYDNFARQGTGNAGAIWPGLCAQTLHPWRVDSGVFSVSSSQRLTAPTVGACLVPAIKGGISRVVSVTFQLSAAGTLTIVGQSPVDTTGVAHNGGLSGIDVKCVQGSQAVLRMSNGNVLGLVGSAFVANTTYTIDLEILYGWQSASGVLQAQYPVFVRVYLGGTLIGQAAIPPGSAALQSAVPFTFPLYEDGLIFADTTSFVSLFRVRDAAPDPRLRHLITATTTRTAWHYETTVCTSGTFTLTLPSPVQDVPNTIVNTGTGTITVAPPSGALTNLSGATGNLTLTQGQKAEIFSPDGTNFQQVG
jgi:hypothetical protein